MYCWQSHLLAELNDKGIVGRATYRQTICISIISRRTITFLLKRELSQWSIAPRRRMRHYEVSAYTSAHTAHWQQERHNLPVMCFTWRAHFRNTHTLESRNWTQALTHSLAWHFTMFRNLKEGRTTSVKSSKHRAEERLSAATKRTDACRLEVLPSDPETKFLIDQVAWTILQLSLN
jgi:hypothetical protein